MMDFSERVIPNVSANFLYQEALARYAFAKKLFTKRGARLSVLDVACGTGYGAAYLSDKHTVCGIDISSEAIAYAKKKYGKLAEFKVCDFEKRMTHIKEYDAICAFEIIEHVHNPRNFLRNVYSSLTDDGLFVLSTPNDSFPKITKSPYHVKEYTEKELKKFLSEFFQNVDIYGQEKDAKAKKALAKFLESQNARQGFVDSDKFGLRKLIPKSVKEKVWKYIGAPFGRKQQDSLNIENFPITKNVKNAEYFVCVCSRKKTI